MGEGKWGQQTMPRSGRQPVLSLLRFRKWDLSGMSRRHCPNPQNPFGIRQCIGTIAFDLRTRQSYGNSHIKKYFTIAFTVR